MTIKHVPAKRRMSFITLSTIATQKRRDVTKGICGCLMVVVGLVLVLVDPVHRFTLWFTTMRQDNFVYHMWEKPVYQIYSDVWIFNYTNVPEFLAGENSVLKLEEVGPFTFTEERLNLNITIDGERGVAKMHPKMTLHFLPELSVGHYSDFNITIPNLAVLALGTLAADKLGYIGNTGAYVSMAAMDSKLFRSVTAEEYFYGYHDPIVKLGNTLLPGWIDFEEVGLLDRFYTQKEDAQFEIILKDEATRYSLVSWDNSSGLTELGYRDWNTSTPCNRIRGTYEGLTLSPGVRKDKDVVIFRKQVCKIFPFSFENETSANYGFTEYRFSMQQSAFNNSSPYTCPCNQNCLPDGFADISGCYYGLPVALSKPHFLDAEPTQLTNFDGLHPESQKHSSYFNVEPTYGIPTSLRSAVQANIAVRTSPYNLITEPLSNKILPLAWVSLYCEGPPPRVINILRLRFVIAPPLMITAEVLLFVVGAFLSVQGFYRFSRSQGPVTKKRRPSVITILENKAFKAHNNRSKEAASLLAVNDEDLELPDIITTNNGYDSGITSTGD